MDLCQLAGLANSDYLTRNILTTAPAVCNQ